jgi:hypothetical protein
MPVKVSQMSVSSDEVENQEINKQHFSTPPEVAIF